MAKSSVKRPAAVPLDAASAVAAIVDHGFIPARARLIEVAAFLDRADRYKVAGDFRCVALRQAAAILADGRPERARRILEHLSDPTRQPAEKSSGKAAVGAWLATGGPEEERGRAQNRRRTGRRK